MLQQGHEIHSPVTQPTYILFLPFIHCTFSLNFLALLIAFCSRYFSRTKSLMIFFFLCFLEHLGGDFYRHPEAWASQINFCFENHLALQRSKLLNFFSLLWEPHPERLRNSELIYKCPCCACWNVAQCGVSNLQSEINSIIHTWYITRANVSVFLGSSMGRQGAVLHSCLPRKAHLCIGWRSGEFFLSYIPHLSLHSPCLYSHDVTSLLLRCSFL